jgi:pimeloyl-ACP methyl ester carboxylesterase
MPVTAAGTQYTRNDFTTSYGEPGIYGISDASLSKVGLPLVLFIHGNTGEDQSSADNQFTIGYTPVREWIIDNGGVYVECRGGGANWGNQAGRDAYRAAFADMQSLFDIGSVVVIGRSMGGLLGAYFASSDPVIAPLARGFVCMSGTLDLTYRYSIATGVDRINLQAAYGGSSSMTQAEFATAAAAFDPMLVPESMWAGRKAIQQYATADGTVAPNRNAIPWMQKYGPPLASLSQQVTDGGDHNSAAGKDPAQAEATMSFLGSIWEPPTNPLPSSYVRVRSRRLLLQDGLHLIH